MTRARILTLLACLFLVLSPALALAGQKPKPEPIRLYLFTATAEFVDEASKHRTDALDDIRKHLRGKQEITLVDARADADAAVEVLRRTREDAERDSDHKSDAPLMLVHVRLTAGAYSVDIKGDSRPALMERRAAAKDAGNRIVRWVKENRDRLIAARAKAMTRFNSTQRSGNVCAAVV